MHMCYNITYHSLWLCSYCWNEETEIFGIKFMIELKNLESGDNTKND